MPDTKTVAANPKNMPKNMKNPTKAPKARIVGVMSCREPFTNSPPRRTKPTMNRNIAQVSSEAVSLNTWKLGLLEKVSLG